MLPNDIYEKVGGYNNFYWGWDYEDHEMLQHLKRLNITIRRQSKHIGTSYNDTYLHLHDDKVRPRDHNNFDHQGKSFDPRDPKAGLVSSQYKLVDVQETLVDGHQVTFVNVELFCNTTLTPWCKFD